MTPVLILLRFVQYSGAAILFGASLFFLYSPVSVAAPRWTRPLLLWAATALAIATPLSFFFQLVQLAGSVSAAMDPPAWHAALFEMNFGKSSIARFVLALIALAAIRLVRADRRLWWISATLGACISASFAWMGHGAASEGGLGWLHLGADILHSLAAAAWIGALVVFFGMLRKPNDVFTLHVALAAFSGTGSLLVAVIVLTGLVNMAYLTGWDPQIILTTAYGQVLAMKLMLLLMMLVLAAMNRYRHIPALGAAVASWAFDRPLLIRLRRSIALETGAAFAVLAAVSWLGTLPPVLE